jgi:TetR/AcrR family transcriptional regulator, transcriptional repressor for nem operon
MIALAIFAGAGVFRRWSVKVTKEQATENRARIVAAAARLFRERGIDGVGIAEICRQAGLTHGALYAQFPSKEALAAAAFDRASGDSLARLKLARGRSGSALEDCLNVLISTRHRDTLASCPLTASASEVARKDKRLSASFAAGFQRLVDIVESALSENLRPAERAGRALTMVAAEIGAIAVARATAKAHPELSARVLTTTKQVLLDLGRAPGQRTKRRRKRRT